MADGLNPDVIDERRLNMLPAWVTPYLVGLHMNVKPLTLYPRLSPKRRATMVARALRLDKNPPNDDPGIDGVFSIYGAFGHGEAGRLWCDVAGTIRGANYTESEDEILYNADGTVKALRTRDRIDATPKYLAMAWEQAGNALHRYTPTQCFAIICDAMAGRQPTFWRDYRAYLLRLIRAYGGALDPAEIDCIARHDAWLQARLQGLALGRNDRGGKDLYGGLKRAPKLHQYVAREDDLRVKFSLANPKPEMYDPPEGVTGWI